MRVVRFDPNYFALRGNRLNEAVMHYGDALKAITIDKFGDGIMSAIDFYVRVEKLTGKDRPSARV